MQLFFSLQIHLIPQFGTKYIPSTQKWHMLYYLNWYLPRSTQYISLPAHLPEFHLQFHFFHFHKDIWFGGELAFSANG